jgi:hypothetical protein
MVSAPGLPEGSGYATFTVASHGMAYFSFVLGDDTPFTLSAPLTGAGPQGFRIPLYKPLYRLNGGCLHGYLSVAEDLAATPVLADGRLLWSRPADSRDADYPGGFAFLSDILVSSFAFTQGELIFPDFVAGSVLNLNLLGGGLPETVTATFGFTAPSNTPEFVSPVPLGIKLAFLPRRGPPNGAISGTYVHPVTGRVLSIKGVLLQNPMACGGFFRSSAGNGHGNVSVTGF